MRIKPITMIVNPIRRKLTKSEVEQHICDIKSGSVEAMVALSADAIAYHSENVEFLKEQFDFIRQSNHGYNAGVWNNLACMAVAMRDYDFAKMVAKSSLVDGLVGNAYRIQICMRETENPELIAYADKLLEKAAKGGHILAKKVYFVQRVSKFGILRYILSIPYLVYLAIIALRIYFKDKHDPRIDYLWDMI